MFHTLPGGIDPRDICCRAQVSVGFWSCICMPGVSDQGVGHHCHAVRLDPKPPTLSGAVIIEVRWVNEPQRVQQYVDALSL